MRKYMHSESAWQMWRAEGCCVQRLVIKVVTPSSVHLSTWVLSVSAVTRCCPSRFHICPEFGTWSLETVVKLPFQPLDLILALPL